MNDINTPLEQLPVDERSSVAKFAMSLLSFSLVVINKKGLVRSVVSRFNRNLFLDFCGRSGLNYDAQLCDFDQISSILFREGVTWISRQVLFDAIYDVGSRHGFEPIKNGRKIMCSRVFKTKKERASPVQRVGVKKELGCTFLLTLLPLCLKSTGMLNKDCCRWFFKMNQCISVNRAHFTVACAILHHKTLWMYDLLPVPTCGPYLTTPCIACAVSLIQAKV